MGAQNFNFDAKFPQNKSFSASKFAFFDEKFLRRRRFSDSPKFRGGVPPATTPLIALKYEATKKNIRKPWLSSETFDVTERKAEARRQNNNAERKHYTASSKPKPKLIAKHTSKG